MESTVTNKSILRSWILVVCVALIVRAAGNIFLPSISYMATDLNVDEAEATSNLNLYYIVLAISYIALGPICDRYQKSKLLRLGLLGCIVGCVLSAVGSQYFHIEYRSFYPSIVGRCNNAIFAVMDK